MTDRFLLPRRTFLQVLAASLVASAAVPGIAFAQGSGPIKLGSLTPLTGAGAAYGGRMRDAIAAVVDAVNAAGGIAGREIQLVSEDDQTNPEAAVRAARKLIDVDGVAAILGVWASSVTTAIAPLCWESKTMVFCTSGADSVTKLPHNGYLVRTEPSPRTSAGELGKFIIADGATSLGWIGPQSPFAVDYSNALAAAGETAGLPTKIIIYEAEKTSYRSEVDQLLAAGPDYVLLGGYAADTIVVLRALYRAGYAGKIILASWIMDETVLTALPPEVTNGIITYSTVTPDTAPGLIAAKELLGTENIDPYEAQSQDHASLAILALAAADAQDGEGIRNALRSVSQGDGQVVGSAVEGLTLLASGQSVNFDGASGELTFDEAGDITTVTLRYDVIRDGKFELLQAAS